MTHATTMVSGGAGRRWTRLAASTAVVAALLVGGVVSGAAAQDATGGGPTTGTHRTFCISADTVLWDFAPDHRNDITGMPFGAVEDVFVASGPDRIGSAYYLSLYREYADATFTTLVEWPPDQAYMGILGPAIHLVVGDTADVVFRNATPHPASIHAHGVEYDKASEGAPYDDGTRGGDKDDDAVPPGSTYTYHWSVPERAGPGPMDPISVVWMYHSHVNEVQDTNSGLVGPIVVTRAGDARPDGTPRDVDQEVFAYFSVMDQNPSLYLQRDIDELTAGPTSVDPDDGEFIESNLMHSINGYVYGNMPMIEFVEGSRVRWDLLTLGTEVDLHTPHWHGDTVLMNGMNRSDMVQLLPGAMMVADMVPDDQGIWLFHCHVNDHILAGMQTRCEVLPASR